MTVVCAVLADYLRTGRPLRSAHALTALRSQTAPRVQHGGRLWEVGAVAGELVNALPLTPANHKNPQSPGADQLVEDRENADSERRDQPGERRHKPEDPPRVGLAQRVCPRPGRGAGRQ